METIRARIISICYIKFFCLFEVAVQLWIYYFLFFLMLLLLRSFLLFHFVMALLFWFPNVRIFLVEVQIKKYSLSMQVELPVL